MGKKKSLALLSCYCPKSEGTHTSNWGGMKGTVCEGKKTKCYIETFRPKKPKKITNLKGLNTARVFIE